MDLEELLLSTPKGTMERRKLSRDYIESIISSYPELNWSLSVVEQTVQKLTYTETQEDLNEIYNDFIES